MRRAARAAPVAVGLAVALALSGCARKGDPFPPEGAVPLDPAPSVRAPSTVTDPIRDAERLSED